MARRIIVPDMPPFDIANDDATVEEIRSAVGLLYPQYATASLVVGADGTVTFQRAVGGEKGR